MEAAQTSELLKRMPIKAHVNRPAIISRKTGADPATQTVASSQQSTCLGLALTL
jgi:hypothetical protein